MKHVTLRLSITDLRTLASLAADQLFRLEYIDVRMPGHQSDPGQIERGKALVERLRSLAETYSPKNGVPARVRT